MHRSDKELSIEADDVARVVRFKRAEGEVVTQVNVPYEAFVCWVEEGTRHAPLSDKRK